MWDSNLINLEVNIIDEDLYNSVVYNLTDSPIFINNSDPEHDWDKISSESPWLTGSGTSVDPYVIKDIFISSKNSNCIRIFNSDVFFIITNSYIHSSGYTLGIGVYLFNVSNGFLIYSEITNNEYHGIAIHKSSKISVYNNLIHYNNGSGISMSSNSDIEISGNFIKNNKWAGIEHYSSNMTVITGNEIESNYYEGVRVGYSNRNEISENIIRDNEDGISLSKANDNLIYKNIIQNNSRYGIFLEENSNFNTIRENSLLNSQYCIVIGDSCQNNDLFDNGDCQFYTFEEPSPPPPPPSPPSPPINETEEDPKIPGYNLIYLIIIVTTITSIIIVKKAKRLISLGDIGTHNYKIIPKVELLSKEVENLRI